MLTQILLYTLYGHIIINTSSIYCTILIYPIQIIANNYSSNMLDKLLEKTTEWHFGLVNLILPFIYIYTFFDKTENISIKFCNKLSNILNIYLIFLLHNINTIFITFISYPIAIKTMIF